MSDNSWSLSDQSKSKQMAGQTVHSALWIQRALTYFFGHHSLFELKTIGYLFYKATFFSGSMFRLKATILVKLSSNNIYWVCIEILITWCSSIKASIPTLLASIWSCTKEFGVVSMLIMGSLTHWGWAKMADIFQTTFSNAFYWMKIYEFGLSFHWKLFLGVQLTKFQHWFRKWLAAIQETSHCLNRWWLIYWRIFASLGLNELSSN